MITFLWTLLASKWLSWIGVAMKAIWWGISSFFRGLSFLQNPFEMFTVGVLALVVCGLTYSATWRFAGDKYRQCQADKVALWNDMSNKDREDARKAAEAKAARAAEEAAERQRQQINEDHPLAAVVPPVAVAPPVVRKGAAPLRGRKCEQGLFGCL
jgi:hypothetical protein